MQIETAEKAYQRLFSDEFIQFNMSQPWNKEEEEKTLTVKKIRTKEGFFYQIETFRENKALHRNMDLEEIKAYLEKKSLDYRSWFIRLPKESYHVRISKKQKAMVSHQKEQNQRDGYNHDKEKNYVMKQGVPLDFLVYLGIMNEDGMVKKARMDKFKQLNHYLLFVEDILSQFDKEESLKIVDFGCGKSYLTFALAYYLREKGYHHAQIVGLDLKKDVILRCNQIARDLKYDNLIFQEGNIKDYEENHVDMVISLHACDVATDYAIYKALTWNSKVMFMVPCCQHEIFGQIDKNQMPILLKHGLIRERFSALLTDSIRGELIRSCGYEVSLMEFIDMEHTPKNILIRGIRKISNSKFEPTVELQSLLNQFKIEPTLYQLLREETKESELKN